MKLWEVLKELDENPNKRFKSVNYNQEEIIISMGTGCYDLPFRVLDSNRDWQEIKQPVTWQEAIEAWANGGKVKCILHGESFIYDSSQWKNMYSGDGYLCDSEILNGTWYIED